MCPRFVNLLAVSLLVVRDFCPLFVPPLVPSHSRQVEVGVLAEVIDTNATRRQDNSLLFAKAYGAVSK